MLFLAPQPRGIIPKAWALSTAGLLLLYISTVGVPQARELVQFYWKVHSTFLIWEQVVNSPETLSSYCLGIFTALSLNWDCSVPIAGFPASTTAVISYRYLLATTSLYIYTSVSRVSVSACKNHSLSALKMPMFPFLFYHSIDSYPTWTMFWTTRHTLTNLKEHKLCRTVKPPTIGWCCMLAKAKPGKHSLPKGEDMNSLDTRLWH